MAVQLPKELFSLELQSSIWKTRPTIIRLLAKALLFCIETVCLGLFMLYKVECKAPYSLQQDYPMDVLGERSL